MTRRLDREVRAGERLLLDTSVLVAYLAGDEPTSGAASAILDDLVRPGRNAAVVSTVTAAELLVRPIQAGTASARKVATFLQTFPNLVIRSVDFLVAAEAARIRALTGIRMPDALILATAALTSTDRILTNDRGLARATGGLRPAMMATLLADLSGER